jgi:hypothetical protein
MLRRTNMPSQEEVDAVRKDYLTRLESHTDFMVKCLATAVSIWKIVYTVEPEDEPEAVAEINKDYEHIPEYAGAMIINTVTIRAVLDQAFGAESTQARYAKTCEFLQSQLMENEKPSCRAWDMAHQLDHIYADKGPDIDELVKVLENVLGLKEKM